MPRDILTAVSEFLAYAGEHAAWAVRSSATDEDEPTASFAGQYESYLNLVGFEAVVGAIRGCWASLFSERAVTYREQNGTDHRSTRMAVSVQQMVLADASGVMFTADPMSGDRTVVAIEAGPGIGEALVCGAIVPESFKLRDGQIIAANRRDSPILSDEQAGALAAIGRRIENHFGHPLDVEWCLLEGGFQIVQSRPITTLFPIPPRSDHRRYVYLSVGHQQMMTDAMRPLGLSIWQMLAARPMHEAGGRLFVDITAQLAAPAARKILLERLSRDPLTSSAIHTLLERGFIASIAEKEETRARNGAPANAPDPAVVADLIAQSEDAVVSARRSLAAKSGNELFDFIADDIAALKEQLMAPRSIQALMAGIEAMWWLNDHFIEWLDERGVADTLSQSVDNNITSQMGLDLLDVAADILTHAAAVSFMRQLGANASLCDLKQVDGGRETLDAIDGYLSKYGMRCAGEIDITRTRWREQPTALLPMILANIDQFTAGEAARRFQAGLMRAKAAEADVLARLRTLPDGAAKAQLTRGMLDRLRAFIGYREYPKYGWMSRIDLYKQAMLAEAKQLADQGVLDHADDIFYLRFEELREVVRTQCADRDLIVSRRAEFAIHERLASPRVLTSDGETLFGRFERDDLPANAIPGLAVSAGSVEGRARVITDIATADIQPGDILVTHYTDPSWPPLFVTLSGLVTEAGGQMSHGAVIAREYGLPAVVAVQEATRRIEDGQRIHLDGSNGVITIVPTD